MIDGTKIAQGFSFFFLSRYIGAVFRSLEKTIEFGGDNACATKQK